MEHVIVDSSFDTQVVNVFFYEEENFQQGFPPSVSLLAAVDDWIGPINEIINFRFLVHTKV